MPTIIEQKRARATTMRQATRETRVAPSIGIELRNSPDGTGGIKRTVSGYGSVFNAEYEIRDAVGTFTEIVAPGAFRATLAKCPDINLNVNHEGLSLARTKSGTLKLAEDEKGLHFEATLDTRRADVQTVVAAIEAGDIDECSFSFRIAPGGDTWSDDFTRRTIRQVDMPRGADVSLCNFGASPATAGLDLRGLGWKNPRQVAARMGGRSHRTRSLDLFRARAWSLNSRSRS